MYFLVLYCESTEVQEKENEVVVLCSLTSSTKRKIRQLYSNGKE